MKNSEKKLIKSKVQLADLSLMLKLVYLDNPLLETPEELSAAINELFEVDCTPEDIKGYHSLYIQSEDYELENRKQKYGIIY